jgi:hypothetical protein
LVIAIGTFPYALRAVATPWSIDLDKQDPYFRCPPECQRG